jgi:uncharacterized OB-fold protein
MKPRHDGFINDVIGYRTLELVTQCPDCGTISLVSVPDDGGYERWLKGDLIQNALPTLKAGDREKLITGICPKCWAKIFPPEEEG